MSNGSGTAGYDITKTPDNHGVTYEELKLITRNRHSSVIIGENDIM